MFDGNNPKGYNPFMATSKILNDLRQKMKKGSTYKNNLGITKIRSDFERGVAFGRYQLLCEQAKYYKENKKVNQKERDSHKYETQGWDTL